MADSGYDLTLGVIEVAVIVAAFLLGVVSLQTWNYFRTFREDMWYIKALVATIYCLDVLHSIFITHALYYYTITFYAHPEALLTSTWSINMSLALHAVIAFVVQCFFCFRILRLTNSYILTGFCLAAATTQFITTVYLVNKAFDIMVFIVFFVEMHPEVVAVFSLVAGTDVLISGTTCVALWRLRNSAEIKDKLLDRVISFVLGSGSLASLGTIVVLATVLTMPNFVWFAVLIVMAKLFTNSLLASLNGRAAMRQRYVDRGMVFSQKLGQSSRIPLNFATESHASNYDDEKALPCVRLPV